MSEINNGGPAFPTAMAEGMSLRDWFAGQVLIGLSVRREGKCNADDAANAYSLADAMIKAREANK